MSIGLYTVVINDLRINGILTYRVRHGWLTEKLNRYPIFQKTDTENWTDQKTENQYRRIIPTPTHDYRRTVGKILKECSHHPSHITSPYLIISADLISSELNNYETVFQCCDQSEHTRFHSPCKSGSESTDSLVTWKRQVTITAMENCVASAQVSSDHRCKNLFYVVYSGHVLKFFLL